MNRRAEFDTGPLSWVKAEIDLAMKRGAEALRAFAGGDAGRIGTARASLHQAHGALRIVGLDGITEVSGELEAVLADIEQGTAAANAVTVADRAFGGLCAYLDGLMAGQAHQALRLLPLYQALCAARGGEANRTADPVDLFHPKLDFRPPWREKAPVQMHAEELVRHLREQRTRFQRGFLAWIKGVRQGAAEMRGAAESIEQTQGAPAQRAFWWAAVASLDALVCGALADAPATEQRRLCNRVESQIRRLIEGSGLIQERVLREVLYALALARPANELIRQAQEACGLVGAAAAQEPEEQEAARPVVPRAAHEQLALAREAWSRYAAAPASHLSSLDAYAKAAAAQVRELAGIGNEDLTALAARLARIGEGLQVEPARMSEAIALETATALLLLESALDGLADAGGLSGAFGEQSRFVCARLEAAMAGRLLRTAPDIPLLDEMSRQAQERLVLEQVVDQMQASLRSLEQVLDAFFRNPARRETLAGVGGLVAQLTGALSMLGESGAREALTGIEGLLARFADPACEPQQSEFEAVAQVLSALGFHIAALARGEASDFESVLRPQARPRSDAMQADPVHQMPAMADGAAGDAPALSRSGPGTADTPVMDAPHAPVDEPSVDAELLGVFLEEAEEVLLVVAHSLARLRAAPADQEVLVAIRRGFHTLKGSGRMVGLNRLGEAAWAVEQALNWWLRESRPAAPQVMELVAGALSWFSLAVGDLKAGSQVADPAPVVQLADAVKSGGTVKPDPAQPSVEPSPAAPVTPDEEAGRIAAMAAEDMLAQAGTAAAVVPEPAAGVQVAADEGQLQLGDASVSTTVFTLFSGEAHALMGSLRAEHETLKIHGIVTDEMIHSAHTLAGIAGTVQLAGLSALGHALERALEQLARDSLSESEQGLVGEAIETLGGMVEMAVSLQVPDAPHALVARLEEAAIPRLENLPGITAFHADPDVLLPEEEAALHRSGDMQEAPKAENAPGGRPLQRRDPRLHDEIDPQLLPLFLEEAAELEPAIGEDLRGWRTASGDPAMLRPVGLALQRHLHTLKGSARMAGAMAVGDLTHHMETRVEAVLAGNAAPAPEELDASFDRLCELLEGLRQTAIPAQANDAAAAAPVVQAEERAPEAGEAAVPAAGSSMLRVRADAVDRMVDQTGEISIARSRIEAELRGLKGAMQELTDNVLRLRAQLREIEIQAESQMQAANTVQAPDTRNARGFDPLEFDRFTRFQELTRIMAESVNDVQTVHQNLMRSVEGTDAALAAQARLNRELQQDLMRVRMVAFATLAERLYRVVRQTAKDAGKRASLDIRGGSVELDRAVLERMTGPIEHALRNAVVHGIESPAARVAAGKPEIGDIRIEVSQEGSEMRLALTDDGAGLDLEGIRAKAVQTGLIAAQAQVSDEELGNLIFHPGFSTAAELTQSAGRGVGMDVVRSEVAGLGGRVELDSRRGEGLSLTIYLPLTLAVTQVVLVRAGARVHALPAVIVEQVMQYRPEQLGTVMTRGHVEWNGRRYPLRYLPHLLGEPQAVPEHKRLASVVLMRSGASALALQVDEILGGNQEVVVKAIGPQLQSVPGIAGATLMGSGDIVLILNPVPLAAIVPGPDKAPLPEPVPADEALPPLILVVDDSLTVRKVTGRLLERQGWTVVTARDGVEALDRLKEGRPDVMLVDIEMPRMDGFELARHVRNDPSLPGLPIIMISSRTADKHRNVAAELGVNAFLGKPFQEDELLAHINGFLKRS